MPILEFRKISKVFEGGGVPVPALAEVDLCVDEGEFVTIVGPSGCGKTTLLMMAAGFMSPTSGDLLLDGSGVSGPDSNRGMVFQDFALFPWLTVRENAMFHFSLAHGRRRIEQSADGGWALRSYVDHLLEFMGLSEFRDRLPRELSSGMKQRVAIVRTLASRPRVVLMDEPFSALDAQTREQMQELLLMLRVKAGMTVLFVTHDVDEAVFLSDRVVALSSRPGHVIKDCKVDAPTMRGLDFKESSLFLNLKHDLLHTIRTQCAPSFDRNVLLDSFEKHDEIAKN